MWSCRVHCIALLLTTHNDYPCHLHEFWLPSSYDAPIATLTTRVWSCWVYSRILLPAADYDSRAHNYSIDLYVFYLPGSDDSSITA